MNIRDLQYLVTLADLKHFGKAAEACFVSQPALSMQIKKLEQELGVPLLERHSKSVLLTTAGHHISEKARTILTHVNELREWAQQAQDPFCGEIHLGIFPTLAPYLLPHIMPALQATYPKISFYLVEEKTPVLLEQLHQGKLHASFLALPLEEPHLTTVPLFEEAFLLATSIHHPLASRTTLDPVQLHHQSLLLLEEGHCLRHQALAVCHSVKALENKHFRATSLETLRHMVASGLGITLMPKLACHPHANIRYVPFATQPPTRTIGLCWRTTSQPALLQHLAQYLQQLPLATL